MDVECDYGEIIGQFPTVNYEYARQQLQKISTHEVVVNLMGCLLVLYNEKDLKFEGVDIIIVSDIPLYSGVGAITSYEIASAKSS